MKNKDKEGLLGFIGKEECFYHYTDKKGAREIEEKDKKIYLTKIPPNTAKPLLGEGETEMFEKYFIRKDKPKNVVEIINRYYISVVFKWRHKIMTLVLKKPIIPLGRKKMKHVMVLIKKSNIDFKKDKYGELYVVNPIKRNSDSNFKVFWTFL